MLQWENEEEEPEDPLRDPQVEEDHLQLEEEQQRNLLQQQQT